MLALRERRTVTTEKITRVLDRTRRRAFNDRRNGAQAVLTGSVQKGRRCSIRSVKHLSCNPRRPNAAWPASRWWRPLMVAGKRCRSCVAAFRFRWAEAV